MSSLVSGVALKLTDFFFDGALDGVTGSSAILTDFVFTTGLVSSETPAAASQLLLNAVGTGELDGDNDEAGDSALAVSLIDCELS